MVTLPPKTLEQLSAEHPLGTRHTAKIKLAMSMLGNGISPQAVFAELRTKFPQATEKEIEGVIAWCADKNPQPTQYRNAPLPSSPQKRQYRLTNDRQMTLEPPEKRAEKLLRGFRVTEAEVTKKSPCAPNALLGQAYLLFMGLYAPDDFINIVWDFTVNDKGKANPKGEGRVVTRDVWLNAMDKQQRNPCSDAGAWIRPNPLLSGVGSGYNGAVCDKDVKHFRFLVLESDCLPMDVQLALLCSLKMKTAAIICSGGKSYHAWLRLDAKDREDYALQAARILTLFKPYGFDEANKNPSRLSRLPGVVRKIGAHKSGEQRLVYLNPEPEMKSIL